MNIKKTQEADLENKRPVFFLLGFIVVLASLFVLLNWKSEEYLSPDWAGFDLLTVEDDFEPEQLITPSNTTPTEVKQEKIVAEEKAPVVAYENFNLVENAEVQNDTLIAEPPIDKLKEELEKERRSQAQVIEQIYTDAEVMPQYPGGYAELNRFIFQHLKYPASAISAKKQGRVWCSFVIEKDGTVSQITLEQAVYVSLDQEAMRVLHLLPRWTPGTVRNENVRVKIYLPIVFKL
jgi:protein TonB